MSNVVKYTTEHEPLKIDVTGPEWFSMWADYPAIKTCSWFRSLPNKTQAGINKASVRVENMKRGIVDGELDTMQMTARSCPAIVEYMNRCLVIKAPCDMDFALTDARLYETNLHKKIFTGLTSETRLPPFHSHPPMQFTSSSSNHFKDHLNIKLDTKIHLICQSNVEPVFAQPLFHNPNAPFKIIPGSFKNPYSRYVSLIWNVMVPESVETFSINKGDALFYVYFNEKVKFKYTKERQDFFKDRFWKPMSLLTDLLGENK